MPDDDIFQRTFAPGWLKAYRLTRDEVGSDVEVADALAKGLSRSLRQGGGCPGLQDIATITGQFEREKRRYPLFATSGALGIGDAFSRLSKVVQQHGGHRTTIVAVRAAESLMVKPMEADLDCSAEGITEKLAQSTCDGLVDHYFFGRAREYLVGTRFPSFREEKTWERRIKDLTGPGVERMAKQLAKDPSAGRIRAPRRISGRRSTEEMLNESLFR